MTQTRVKTIRTGLAVIALSGCGSGRPATSDDGTGTLMLALTSMAGSATYALVDATFTVAGVQPAPPSDDPRAILGQELRSSGAADLGYCRRCGLGRSPRVQG